MDLQIIPRSLAGAVTPPPSKSMSHRLLMAASLANGVSTVQNIAFSEDIRATLRCMEQLGASGGFLHHDRHYHLYFRAGAHQGDRRAARHRCLQ